MKGIQTVHVENAKASFDFTLRRNITIVRGKSASGKTTLCDMVVDYVRRGDQSGIRISSNHPCTSILSQDWEAELKKISNSIVFIDEGSRFISSKAFAKALQHNDNYFIIFTRESLEELPYSVNEIYEIAMVGRSRKKHYLKPIYSFDAYHRLEGNSEVQKSKIEIFLTEDSNSGYQFFKSWFQNTDIKCQSGQSKTKLFNWLQMHSGQKIFMIADGAAFGPEIDRIYKWQEEHPDQSIICLPESFEWLLLESGVIQQNGIKEVLENPEEYIESADYISWERFFTKYLEDISAETIYAYTKRKINPYYTKNANASKVIALIAI